MRPLSNPADLIVGQVIHHQPRNTFYQILNKTMVKKETEGWEYGWSYQEVEVESVVHDVIVFTPNTTGIIYSRPFSKFDSDWMLPI